VKCDNQFVQNRKRNLKDDSGALCRGEEIEEILICGTKELRKGGVEDVHKDCDPDDKKPGLRDVLHQHGGEGRIEGRWSVML
jgi:hypothetical protein